DSLLDLGLHLISQCLPYSPLFRSRVLLRKSFSARVLSWNESWMWSIPAYLSALMRASVIPMPEARIKALKYAGLDHIQLSFQDRDRKSTRLNSSHRTTSYAVFCLE